MFYGLLPPCSLSISPVYCSCYWHAHCNAHNKHLLFALLCNNSHHSRPFKACGVNKCDVVDQDRLEISWDKTLSNIRPIVATAAFATMRRSHREHCTHSTLIVHLLPSKERSCSLDSRNLGYNNKPHIRPAQSRRLYKGTVGCTFSPLNEAPTLPLCYILKTDATGCDAQLVSMHCVFLGGFLSEPRTRFTNTGRKLEHQWLVEANKQTN